MAKKDTDAEIRILELEWGQLEMNIVGTSPLILNRMSAKSAKDLLMPPRKKNVAERHSTLKHNPIAEYRASAYTTDDAKSPTRLLMLSTAFKRAIADAAKDIPGAAKAEIGRLTFIEGVYTPVYGVPKLFMAITRNSDMKRTPDVRTRAIVPAWASVVTVRYVRPLLNEQAVANLLAAAGIIRGVGDWRPEKGGGDFGQFKLVEQNDKEFKKILETGGRAAQDKALANPEPYDVESADLLTYFLDESKRRGFPS